MTEVRKVNLELSVFHLERMEGDGGELVVVCQAERKTKAGTPERYFLRLKLCRFGLAELLGEVRKMHVRDRQRLAREKARIDEEINSLQVRP